MSKTTTEKLHVLGNSNLDQPSGVVDIRAPISGVITDQQVTNAAGLAGLSSPNPFTISDLSTVWVLCDVYENDLPAVRSSETRLEVRLNAYPERVFSGRIGNIGPSSRSGEIRAAKVRLEVANPGSMRVGMFATVTFRQAKKGGIRGRSRDRSPALARPGGDWGLHASGRQTNFAV